MRRSPWLPLLVVALLAAGCLRQPVAPGPAPAPAPDAQPSPAVPAEDLLAPIPGPRTAAEKVVNGAKAEARRGVRYDASYARMSYPGGDVPRDRGACTDVIVRALRHAGYDLQRLIHEDILRARARYPRVRSAGRVDRNIDHRRVPNHLAFLRRHGLSLPKGVTGADAATWQPGDLVYWRLDNGLDHCGVVSNVRNARGLPLAIHNLGVANQEDCLTAWEITGHFRYPKPHTERQRRSRSD